MRESHCHRCIVELSNELDARGVMLNLTSLISALTWKPEEKSLHRCSVELNNELDARGVMLNLASLILALTWKPEDFDMEA